MIYVVPFRAEHIATLKVQNAQEWFVGRVSPSDWRIFETEHSGTAMLDGKPVAVGGAVPIWENRAYVWSILSDQLTKGQFVGLHRVVKACIDALPFRRVECSVEVGFAAGHRWAKALGFECETPNTVMKAFLTNGADCKLYAKVK